MKRLASILWSLVFLADGDASTRIGRLGLPALVVIAAGTVATHLAMSSDWMTPAGLGLGVTT
ncbi:MAG TPA: hypothetical protein VNA32_04340 [Actinomycetota bacterium]|nr:hypothetical protein [Actinomycetota bacterium]